MQYCQKHGVIKERLEDGTRVCRWCQREERVEELEAENARLREQRDNYRHQAWEMGERL